MAKIANSPGPYPQARTSSAEAKWLWTDIEILGTFSRFLRLGESRKHSGDGKCHSVIRDPHVPLFPSPYLVITLPTSSLRGLWDREKSREATCRCMNDGNGFRS